MRLYALSRLIGDRMFTGRLGRMGMLMGFLYYFLISLVALAILGLLFGLLAGFVSNDNKKVLVDVMTIVGTVWYAVVVFSFISLYVRRLHDLNRPGWYVLFMLVPFVNLALFLYLVFAPGSQKSNHYGTTPPPSKFWSSAGLGSLIK
jgi:uncharacterized membrane protein YhaH (DUF805 family)